MRLLVTGGAGYIGRYVLHAAHVAGCNPVWLDKRPTAGPGLTVDMCDREALAAAIDRLRPDVVIHLAAHADVAESVLDPGKYAENVAMCQNLAAVAGHLPIVLASSAAVYGEGGSDRIAEWTRLAPVNPYGWSKLASEAALPGAFALRLFNVAGGVGDEADHLVPRAVQACAAGRGLRVNGQGYAVRDFVHVDDVAQAFLAAVPALTRGVAGEPLNICTGQARSVREAARKVADHAGVYLPMLCGPDRPGDVHYLVGDPTAAGRALGWAPERTFADIVASAWVGARSEAA